MRISKIIWVFMLNAILSIEVTQVAGSEEQFRGYGALPGLWEEHNFTTTETHRLLFPLWLYSIMCPSSQQLSTVPFGWCLYFSYRRSWDRARQPSFIVDVACCVVLSRVLLSRPPTLSSPLLQIERERVEEMGGCVLNIQGTWRVLGQLAVSRAIGQYSLPVLLSFPSSRIWCPCSAHHLFLFSSSPTAALLTHISSPTPLSPLPSRPSPYLLSATSPTIRNTYSVPHHDLPPAPPVCIVHPHTCFPLPRPSSDSPTPVRQLFSQAVTDPLTHSLPHVPFLFPESPQSPVFALIHLCIQILLICNPPLFVINVYTYVPT